jgi:putative transposase
LLILSAPSADTIDNAMDESSWGHIQTELLNTRKWKTRVELSTAVFDWIQAFYNNRTLHNGSLGMISPVADEKLPDHQTSAA